MPSRGSSPVPDAASGVAPGAAFADERGVLVPIELDALPWKARRVFVVTGACPHLPRGGHALRSGTERLVCVAGPIGLLLESAVGVRRQALRKPGEWIDVPPGTRVALTFGSEHAVLLVVCDEAYDPSGYTGD